MCDKTYEEYLEEVKRDGMFLQNIPDQMQTDEIIDAAMVNDTWAFQYIKDDRKKTIDRCLEAVGCDGWFIDYVPDDLKERVKKELGL